MSEFFSIKIFNGNVMKEFLKQVNYLATGDFRLICEPNFKRYIRESNVQEFLEYFC